MGIQVLPPDKYYIFQLPVIYRFPSKKNPLSPVFSQPSSKDLLVSTGLLAYLSQSVITTIRLKQEGPLRMAG